MPGKNEEEIIYMIISVISVIVFLVGIMIAILMAYQKKKLRHYQKIHEMETAFDNQLLQSQIEVQEQTSSALGKELHDNVGQLLNTAKMLIGLSEREIGFVPDSLKTAQRTIADAINELRSLSKSLDKDWLSRFSFLENMEQEAARINASQNIHLSIQSNEKTLPISSDKQIMLFRIVQEAMQNAIKHGAATNIHLKLVTIENVLHISVSDNGKGFIEKENKNNGMGLANIKYRVTVLGGKLNIHSQTGDGTNITIELPANKDC